MRISTFLLRRISMSLVMKDSYAPLLAQSMFELLHPLIHTKIKISKQWVPWTSITDSANPRGFCNENIGKRLPASKDGGLWGRAYRRVLMCARMGIYLAIGAWRAVSPAICAVALACGEQPSPGPKQKRTFDYGFRESQISRRTKTAPRAHFSSFCRNRTSFLVAFGVSSCPWMRSYSAQRRQGGCRSRR